MYPIGQIHNYETKLDRATEQKTKHNHGGEMNIALLVTNRRADQTSEKIQKASIASLENRIKVYI